MEMANREQGANGPGKHSAVFEFMPHAPRAPLPALNLRQAGSNHENTPAFGWGYGYEARFG